MEKKRIGIVGYGTMGAAIAQRLKRDYSLFVFDVDTEKTRNISGLITIEGLSKLFADTDIVLIAVKPQDLFALLQECKAFINAHLFISIAAGVTTQDIERVLKPKEAKVIRVMPNLFVRDACSVTAICRGQYTDDSELFLVQQLFDHLGQTKIVTEEQIDAVTAVAGSAPGYISYLLEKEKVPPDKRAQYIDSIIPELTRAAEAIGLDDARYFAENTGASISRFFQMHPESDAPEKLRKQVASKGGTTEAAIKVLESAGRGKLEEAVMAAYKRARELSGLVRGVMRGG